MISLKLRAYPFLERFSIAVFGGVFIIAGLAHLAVPSMALDYLPPWFFGAFYWVIGTGITELFGAFALLSKRYRYFGAWFLQIHLIAYLGLHGWHVWLGGELPNDITLPLWLVWVRLAFQLILISLMYRIIKVVKTPVSV